MKLQMLSDIYRLSIIRVRTATTLEKQVCIRGASDHERADDVGNTATTEYYYYYIIKSFF